VLPETCGEACGEAGTHITGFTGTKVQILTLPVTCGEARGDAGTHFTCFTGTKVQILTLWLLYCYKSTNTDAAVTWVLNLPALLVQNFKY
jgi:hypothetical protein